MRDEEGKHCERRDSFPKKKGGAVYRFSMVKESILRLPQDFEVIDDGNQDRTEPRPSLPLFQLHTHLAAATAAVTVSRSHSVSSQWSYVLQIKTLMACLTHGDASAYLDSVQFPS